MGFWLHFLCAQQVPIEKTGRQGMGDKISETMSFSRLGHRGWKGDKVKDIR